MSYVIVGLGNPEPEYEGSRHNIGRAAVSHFAKKEGVEEWRTDKKANAQVAKLGKTALVLPDTYMNRSGSAVSKYVKSVKAASQLVIVYDDLDLPLGKLKISFARSSGGHKGVESVQRAIKTDAFIRLRIGVSPTTPSGKPKKPQGEEKVLKFILGKFTPKEKDVVKKILKTTDDALATILEDGCDMAMNRFNQ